jgi:hypothetical protein
MHTCESIHACMFLEAGAMFHPPILRRGMKCAHLLLAWSAHVNFFNRNHTKLNMHGVKDVLAIFTLSLLSSHLGLLPSI